MKAPMKKHRHGLSIGMPLRANRSPAINLFGFRLSGANNPPVLEIRIRLDAKGHMQSFDFETLEGADPRDASILAYRIGESHAAALRGLSDVDRNAKL